MLQCYANQNAHVYVKQFKLVFFFLKIMKIPTKKGRALMQMYRVVPQTKRGN